MMPQGASLLSRLLMRAPYLIPTVERLLRRGKTPDQIAQEISGASGGDMMAALTQQQGRGQYVSPSAKTGAQQRQRTEKFGEGVKTAAKIGAGFAAGKALSKFYPGGRAAAAVAATPDVRQLKEAARESFEDLDPKEIAAGSKLIQSYTNHINQGGMTPFQEFINKNSGKLRRALGKKADNLIGALGGVAERVNVSRATRGALGQQLQDPQEQLAMIGPAMQTAQRPSYPPEIQQERAAGRAIEAGTRPPYPPGVEMMRGKQREEAATEAGISPAYPEDVRFEREFGRLVEEDEAAKQQAALRQIQPGQEPALQTIRRRGRQIAGQPEEGQPLAEEQLQQAAQTGGRFNRLLENLQQKGVKVGPEKDIPKTDEARSPWSVLSNYLNPKHMSTFKNSLRNFKKGDQVYDLIEGLAQNDPLRDKKLNQKQLRKDLKSAGLTPKNILKRLRETADEVPEPPPQFRGGQSDGVPQQQEQAQQQATQEQQQAQQQQEITPAGAQVTPIEEAPSQAAQMGPVEEPIEPPKEWPQASQILSNKQQDILKKMSAKGSPPVRIAENLMNRMSADQRAKLEREMGGEEFLEYVSHLKNQSTRPKVSKAMGIPTNILEEFDQNLAPPGESSAAIRGFIYQPKNKRLMIDFNDTSRYLYKGVPKNTYETFSLGDAQCVTKGKNEYGCWWVGKDPSKGAAFNQHIRGQYNEKLI